MLDVGMNRIHDLFVSFCFALIITSVCTMNASAAISAVVKKGDWMAYNVSFTGTAPEGHDVEWARIEVTNVQGNLITVLIASRDINGAQNSDTVTLDLEKGKLGDEFIIPANLNVGEQFFDANLGNVTIGGSEQRVVAGANRDLLYSESSDRLVYWDKATGFLIEGRTAMPGFTMTTALDATNMWQPESFNAIYLIGALVIMS